MFKIKYALKKLLPITGRAAKYTIRAEFVQIGDNCDVFLVNQEPVGVQEEPLEATPNLHTATADIASREAVDDRQAVVETEPPPRTIPPKRHRYKDSKRHEEGDQKKSPFIHQYLRESIYSK